MVQDPSDFEHVYTFSSLGEADYSESSQPIAPPQSLPFPPSPPPLPALTSPPTPTALPPVSSRRHSAPPKSRKFKFRRVTFERANIPCSLKYDDCKYETLTPYQAFKLFINDEMFDHTATETIRYALQ